MELKHFVAETIKQIIDGVEKAQKYAKAHNGKVNPGAGLKFPEGMGTGVVWDRAGNPGQIIEFDISVSTSEADGLNSRMGVFVGPFGAGVQAKNDQANSNTNRIKFSLPVFLPFQEGAKEYVEPKKQDLSELIKLF